MATQINFFYRSYCETFMTLNIDEKSLFITVPSESDGISYRVDMNEETMQVEKCSCQGFRYHKHCKHQTIVNDAYALCSRSFIINAAMDEDEAIEEAYEMAEIAEQVVAVAPKVETPFTFRKKGGRLVKVAVKTRKPSKIARVIEQAVKASVPTPKTTDISQKGSLYSNKGFRLMR